MPKEILIIKKFGPIKKVELELRKVNIFIGEQAGGKSTLAKLVAIFKTQNLILGESNFKDIFSNYNILSYLKLMESNFLRIKKSMQRELPLVHIKRYLFSQLKKLNNQYCIGEMLDWDTPTGGYLLQACFSMGAYLAKHLNEK